MSKNQTGRKVGYNAEKTVRAWLAAANARQAWVVQAGDGPAEEPYELVYVGSVLTIFPSGKYYTPWANSNVTEEEAAADEHFDAALQAAAGRHGCWLQNGEGDPLDVFLCRPLQSKGGVA